MTRFCGAYLTGIFIVIFSFRALAQESVPQNFASWTGYEGYHLFRSDGRWGIMLEGYIKRNNFVADPMALFGKLGVNYYFKNGSRLSAGIAYQYSYPYDDASLPYEYPDYRLWQQYMIRKLKTKNGRDRLWVHRFRPEERWLGRKSNPNDHVYDSYEFIFTVRYMLRRQWWLTDRFGAAVSDELHLRFPFENDGTIDQNRIYGGILISLDKVHDWRLELGYMLQTYWNSVDAQESRERMNHTFRFTITSDAPFQRIKQR